MVVHRGGVFAQDDGHAFGSFTCDPPFMIILRVKFMPGIPAVPKPARKPKTCLIYLRRRRTFSNTLALQTIPPPGSMGYRGQDGMRYRAPSTVDGRQTSLSYSYWAQGVQAPWAILTFYR